MIINQSLDNQSINQLINQSINQYLATIMLVYQAQVDDGENDWLVTIELIIILTLESPGTQASKQNVSLNK